MIEPVRGAPGFTLPIMFGMIMIIGLLTVTPSNASELKRRRYMFAL